MKVKFSQFIFAFLVCFSVYNFAFTQEKPTAIKFDEYNESNGANLKLLRGKTKQFAKALRKKSESTKGLIYLYQSPRNVPYCKPFDKLEESYIPIKRFFAEELNSLKKKVVIKGLDFKEFFTAEFWIVPKNAEMPKPSQDYIYDLPICCPIIKMKGDEIVRDKKTPLIFSIELIGPYTSYVEPTFTWKVSAGKIIGGQGTSQIKVNAEDANEITATVEISGIEYLCISEIYSFTTKIQ
jgi:hypothetical protein